MAQIVFDHVTKKFKEEIALENISFEIDKGEFVFIIGKQRRRRFYMDIHARHEYPKKRIPFHLLYLFIRFLHTLLLIWNISFNMDKTFSIPSSLEPET